MENVWNSAYKSKQGNVGLGAAIAYYTSVGIPISIPLNDTQGYDLVVDKEGLLYRVSVKTTQDMNDSNTSHVVWLRNSGGSSGKSKTRPFNKESCDILFVLTKSGDLYEIPTDKINVTTALTLTEDWKNYIVSIDYSSQHKSFNVEED